MPLCRFLPFFFVKKGNKLSRPRRCPVRIGNIDVSMIFPVSAILTKMQLFTQEAHVSESLITAYGTISASTPDCAKICRSTTSLLWCLEATTVPIKEKKRGSSKNHRKYPKTQFIALNCTFSLAGAVPHTSRKSLALPLRWWSRLNLLLSAPDNWPLQGISGVLVGSLGKRGWFGFSIMFTVCAWLTTRPVRSSSTLWGQVMATAVPVFPPRGHF